MKETMGGSDYSTKAIRAREKDLKNRFGPDVGIWDPQNISLVRLNDFATIAVDYRGQYLSTQDPKEKKVIGKRLTEVTHQIISGINE